MPAMDTLLFNDPEVKGLAFAILEECTDLQAFGRRMLELLANAAMSAKADEACNAPYGERDEGRVPNRGVSGPSPENRRHPCEVNLSLRPPSGQWRSL